MESNFSMWRLGSLPCSVVLCVVAALLLAPNVASAETSVSLTVASCRDWMAEAPPRNTPLPSEVRIRCPQSVVRALIAGADEQLLRTLTRSESKKCLLEAKACQYATVRALVLGTRATAAPATSTTIKPDVGVAAAAASVAPVAAAKPAPPKQNDEAPQPAASVVGSSSSPAKGKDAVDDRINVLDCPSLRADEQEWHGHLKDAEDRLQATNRAFDFLIPAMLVAVDVAEALGDIVQVAPATVWVSIAAITVAWIIAEWALSSGGLRGVQFSKRSPPPLAHQAALASLRQGLDRAYTAELMGPRLRVAGATLQFGAIMCSLTATVRALNASFGSVIGIAIRAVSLGHEQFGVQAIVTVLFVFLFSGTLWRFFGAWRALYGKSSVYDAVKHARGYLSNFEKASGGARGTRDKKIGHRGSSWLSRGAIVVAFAACVVAAALAL